LIDAGSQRTIFLQVIFQHDIKFTQSAAKKESSSFSKDKFFFLYLIYPPPPVTLIVVNIVINNYQNNFTCYIFKQEYENDYMVLKELFIVLPYFVSAIVTAFCPLAYAR